MSMSNTRQALRQSRPYLWLMLIALAIGPVLAALDGRPCTGAHTCKKGEIHDQHR
jgi:hypothetical protein